MSAPDTITTSAHEVRVDDAADLSAALDKMLTAIVDAERAAKAEVVR